MRKILPYLLAIPLIASCATSGHHSKGPFAFTEKDTIMELNNNVFTRASVVGMTGAGLIGSEKEKALSRKGNEFERKIKEIPDVSVSAGQDGKEFRVNIGNDILFAFDSFALKENSRKTLNELAFSFKEFDDKGSVKVIGHTDNIGSREYNDSLSLRRAETVAAYLKTVGVDGALIQTEGKGMADPVSDNKTEKGRAENRRVEIRFYPARN